MNECTLCDYKVIANKRFEAHMLTHDVQYPEKEEAEVVPETPVAAPVAAPVEVVEAKTEPEKPVVEEKKDPVEMVESEDIVLNFTKPVEVTINAKQYFGKKVVVKDMKIAAEIVRIAREAYGPTILA